MKQGFTQPLRAGAGFTFIELLIAVSIFSVVAIAIYSTFATGVETWRKGETMSGLCQEARLALDSMAGEIRNMIVYKDREFVGERQKLSFTSLVNTSGGLAREQLEIAGISYYLDDTLGSLRRGKESLSNGRQQGLGEEKEIAYSVSGLSFSYAYESDTQNQWEWKDLWEENDTIPSGIKIRLTLRGGPSNEEVTFIKTVFIPIGSIGVSESGEL